MTDSHRARQYPDWVLFHFQPETFIYLAMIWFYGEAINISFDASELFKHPLNLINLGDFQEYFYPVDPLSASPYQATVYTDLGFLGS